MGFLDSITNQLGLTHEANYQPVSINQQAFQDPNAAANRQMMMSALQGYGQQLGTAQEGQAGLVQALQQRMAGQQPSIAEQQMRMGLDQSNQQSMALASSGGGGVNPAMALRQAQLGQAQAQQQTVGQAGMLRAQEQQAAQQQLGQVLGQQMSNYTGAQLSGMGLAQQQSQQQVANQMGYQQAQAQAQQFAGQQNFQQNLANQQLYQGIVGGVAGGFGGALGRMAFAEGGAVSASDGFNNDYGSFEAQQNYARGGKVKGPGGPKDDLIMAKLSDGEFVVNAAAAEKYRPLLEMMNEDGKRTSKHQSKKENEIHPAIIETLKALHKGLSHAN